MRSVAFMPVIKSYVFCQSVSIQWVESCQFESVSIVAMERLDWMFEIIVCYHSSNKKQNEKLLFWFFLGGALLTSHEIMEWWNMSGWRKLEWIYGVANVPAERVCACSTELQLSNNRLISHRVLQSHEWEGLDYVSLMPKRLVNFKELKCVGHLWAPSVWVTGKDSLMSLLLELKPSK